MRGLAILLLTAATLGACASVSAGVSSGTSLTVTYWEDGSRTASRDTWTLRCNPARGTLPRPAIACRRLAAGGMKLFASTPPNVACTQIYGGPQVARVVGTVAGKRVWATFSREDGCAISRWERLSPWLLPAGGVRY
ncbi:MAG: SSI family serine proteinase inhibitor [Gaiellaceae bacterium]